MYQNIIRPVLHTDDNFVEMTLDHNQVNAGNSRTRNTIDWQVDD